MDLSEILSLMIPLGLVVVLPLTALFLHHQRKMAEMVRAQSQEHDLARQVATLQYEVNLLKEQLYIAVLASEDRRGISPPPEPRPTSPDR